MAVLEEMIRKSGLTFLNPSQFEKKTNGRYFSIKRHSPTPCISIFYVILEPNVAGPIHDHSRDWMAEFHTLLYGSGKFLIYNTDGSPAQELPLVLGEPHKVFSDFKRTPRHRFIAGPEGSICQAVEYRPL